MGSEMCIRDSLNMPLMSGKGYSISINMEWEKVKKRLKRLLGPNYANYPKCVEWNIRVMKYLERRKKERELLEAEKNE